MHPERIVAYVPGSTVLVTVPDENGNCIYSGDDFPALQEEYPGVILLPWAEALKRIDDALARKYLDPDPVPVPFSEFLEALRPCPLVWDDYLCYGTYDGSEVYQCSELTESSYTATYVRLGDRDNACFVMQHLAGNLEGAIERVKAFVERSSC